MPEKSAQPNEKEVIGLFGIGLDNADGHHRVTQGDQFMLYGGSAKTHERLVDTVFQVTEQLRKRGQRLNDVSAEDLAKLVRQASE